jgi:hypothetical protein
MLVLCLFGAALPALAQFESRGSIAVEGAGVFSLAVGDFNGDGKLDVAAATEIGQVAVLLGRGDGTFQSPVYYPTAFGYFIAVANLRHNGILDLAVSERLDQNISVLLGNGDGTFQSPVPYSTSTGTEPTSVLVGDFNNDGKLDLLICDEPYVSVMLGNGNGTFQAPIDTTPSLQPEALGVGYFNHDRKLDVASISGGNVTILLGNGDGTFTTGATYLVGTELNSVAVADFNGDGKQDLAIADGLGGQIVVLLGNGDGTFQPPVDYPAYFPGAIIAADLNEDGKQDLVVTNAGPGMISVYSGNGDGTFQPPASYIVGKEIGYTAAGDFNGDHLIDIAVPDFSGSDVGVLLNTGIVSFSPTTPLLFPRQLVGTVSTAQTVTLTNSGATALSITSKSVTGPFQLSTSCGGSVAPAASCDLTVSFQPSVAGAATGLVSLHDSASSKPQVIELNGMGTVIGISPAQLTFSPQKVGSSSKPQAVTVTNTSSTPVSITSVAIAGRISATIQRCGTQINAGAICKITVTFTPGAKGTRDALVNVNDNGGGSPQGVLLTGTGS